MRELHIIPRVPSATSERDDVIDSRRVGVHDIDQKRHNLTADPATAACLSIQLGSNDHKPRTVSRQIAATPGDPVSMRGISLGVAFTRGAISTCRRGRDRDTAANAHTPACATRQRHLRPQPAALTSAQKAARF